MNCELVVAVTVNAGEEEGISTVHVYKTCTHPDRLLHPPTGRKHGQQDLHLEEHTTETLSRGLPRPDGENLNKQVFVSNGSPFTRPQM